jgi:hypothetical protein
MHGQRLLLVLAVLAHDEAHKDELTHIADDFERQTERFLPNRVEPVILDRAGAIGYLDGGRARGRRREETPIGEMHRDLDVRVTRGFIDDLAAIRVFWQRELLSRDHLDAHTRFLYISGAWRRGKDIGVTYGDIQIMLGPFVEQTLVLRSKGEWLEDISRTSVALEHRVVDYVAQVYLS